MKHIGVAVGMDMIERIDRARELAEFYGFRLGRQHHAFTDSGTDVIALYPKDDRLPVYSRDTYLFVGSLSEVENFLDGVQWARKYDNLIGAMSDRRREQFEDKEIARLERIAYNKARAETFTTLKKEYT